MVSPTSDEKLVLIAEDNADLRLIFQTALNRLSCTTLTAVDGREAVRILADYVPDLIVLDINMPHLSGLDVLRWISQDNRFGSTHIIVVSGNHLAASDPIMSYADLFLVKPVDIIDLIRFAARFFSAPIAARQTPAHAR